MRVYASALELHRAIDELGFTCPVKSGTFAVTVIVGTA
jgi:hypothetical protein